MKKQLAFIILLIITMSVFLTGCGKKPAYNDAMTLYENGKYAEAAAKFRELDDYENSIDMVRACDYQTAIELYNSESYDKAQAIFVSLDNYENSAEMVKACMYKNALVLYKASSFADAYSIFAELGDYEQSENYVAKCVHEINLEQYKDVYSALDGNMWYFNGGSDTILNRISFASDNAKIEQVYFDGNGKHDNGYNTFSFRVDDKSIIVTMKGGSELKISYKLLGSKIKLDNEKYFTIEEIDDGLQGYWHCSSSLLGLKDENYIYINNGKLTSESACEGYNLKKGQYYYYGPYLGNYTLNFGGFDSDIWDANRWFFNIINGKATLLHYDNVCSPATKLPGKNGYKF